MHCWKDRAADVLSAIRRQEKKGKHFPSTMTIEVKRLEDCSAGIAIIELSEGTEMEIYSVEWQNMSNDKQVGLSQ